MSKHKEFLAAIKQKHSVIIAEADTNERKWFELFVNKGEDGTETIDSGDTFEQAVSWYEHHAKLWGADKLFLDIWTDKAPKNLPPEVVISLWAKNDIPDSLKTF